MKVSYSDHKAFMLALFVQFIAQIYVISSQGICILVYASCKTGEGGRLMISVKGYRFMI